MTTPPAVKPIETATKARVRVFVDFWNLQLSLNTREAKDRKVADFRFNIDWKLLGPWLSSQAASCVGIKEHSFEGMIVYASYNPANEEGAKFRKWAMTWLARQAGILVECLERKPRALPRCPSCHRDIAMCPYEGCKKKIIGTIEKGVDTLIATDMIRLAWEDAYDIAVLATSDSDLVPAAKFLNQKGRKVVQAGFPPLGVDLATACWASFDIYRGRKEIERPSTKRA